MLITFANPISLPHWFNTITLFSLVEIMWKQRWFNQYLPCSRHLPGILYGSHSQTTLRYEKTVQESTDNTQAVMLYMKRTERPTLRMLIILPLMATFRSEQDLHRITQKCTHYYKPSTWVFKGCRRMIITNVMLNSQNYKNVKHRFICLLVSAG